MDAKQTTEESIFLEAAEISSAEDRQAYLDKACGDDQALRAGVEALLAADAQSGDLLDVAAANSSTVDQAGLVERPGTVIGPYKLLQEIGEGGMGVVYMAEQTEPVKRRVALKIIKPGMDSRQIIARFEAERQALAMMDHPNVARVLDAGTTEAGRPYFVMELVKGIPITKFCDEHQLTPRERLELFVPVCQAVQHAHHKGIIHRDLKPSNVLIAEYDDQAVPKIIDFGVAKALNQILTDKTMFTQYGQIVGTIEYMSPEQAKFNQLDVDTRSDIYSLGVLLYELLTGTTPLDRERLRSSSFDEVMRVISEEDPPRPSTRLSSSETLPTLAASRRTEPKKLPKLVRGELDWIVMTALEKDRTRRYETASALAGDIEHYLNDEPVTACPPSITYRMRKFVRRHRSVLSRTAAAVMFVGLVITAGTYYWKYEQRVGQARERQEALERQQERERWARQEAIPEIRRLVDVQKYVAAFELASEAEAVLPDDPELARLRTQFACDWSILSSPAGADVFWRDYENVDHEWQSIGRTPVESVNLPRGMLLWKMTLAGYEEVLGCRHPDDGPVSFTLDRTGDIPEGMVRVSGNKYRAGLYGHSFDDVDLEDFYIDRYEVTNRQYQEFVDADGYNREDYWAAALDGGLTMEQIAADFVDGSGLPGPVAWRNGTFPEGERDFPVRGVSWYEASAYAAFAGKQLPTIVHWLRASSADWTRTESLQIAQQSHINRDDESGPVAVGSRPGVGPFGTSDMAGNVAEWCANKGNRWPPDGETRVLMGGAWSSPAYAFWEWNEKLPFVRNGTDGFRCMLSISSEIPVEALVTLTPKSPRDLLNESPVDDEIFELLCQGTYAYTKSDLNEQMLSGFENDRFVHEVFEIDAAYGGERFAIHLLLPKGGNAPRQPVLFFPGIATFRRDRPFPVESNPETGPLNLNPLGLADAWNKTLHLVRGGRAVVYPVYDGSFERFGSFGREWEWNIHVYRDLARTIDYLETRKDMDCTRIGYVGFSVGAERGPIMLALEERIRAAVLYHGGLRDNWTPPTRYEAFNFAPRVTIPTLMVNGRNDALYNIETSQLPLYELLGTPAHDKGWIVFDVSHGEFGGDQGRAQKTESQAWFDLHLGPVGDQSEYDRRIIQADFAVVRGDWAGAADHYRAAMQLEPDRAESWTEPQSKQFAGTAGLDAAVALLMAGDDDGYRTLCETITTQFPDALGIHRARLVQSCLLRPDTEAPINVQAWADRLDELPESFRPEITEACALGELRSGAPDEALELLDRKIEGSELSEEQRALRHVIAALAHQQLDEPEDARTNLDEAVELLDDSLPKQEDGTVNPHFAMRSQRLRAPWLIAELLRREAEELLEAPPAPATE